MKGNAGGEHVLRFRGHHLVCLHFYRGAGYDRIFVEKLTDLVRRAEAGEEIQVVAGADDVCRNCPYLAGERCAHKEGADPEILALDETARSFLGVKPGDKVLWRNLKTMVAAAPAEWFARFCEGCDWRGLCERVRREEQG